MYKIPRISLKKLMLEYGLIAIGAFIMAAGFVFFINPYYIVPGGVYGVGIVVHYLAPWIPIGAFGMLMDIPLTLIGIKVLGPKFGLKTIMGIVLMGSFMLLLTHLFGEDDPLGLGDDLLLCSIFGGSVIGFGLGLIFRARATSGGTDIIAMIIAKYTNVPVGQLLIIIDSVVVLLGLVVFKDWTIPLYSWLTIYVTGQVIDITLKGFSSENALMIISKEHQAIKTFIINEMDRGGTYLKGSGMYSGDEKDVIFVVVSRRELPILKTMIHGVDEDAFVTVINTAEILGEGFKPLKQNT